jgi:hypothetical protein
MDTADNSNRKWRIMRYMRLLLVAVPLLAMTACDDDGTSVNNPEQRALVRFLNAVPDTGMVDLRFVDRVENLPTLQGVALQSHSGYYQRVIPGARNAVVFPGVADASGTLELVSQVLVDTTLNLTAPTRHTLVYAGRATNNQDRLVVIEDAAPPTPPANQIALQALHVAVGVGNVDVYVVPVATATAATPDNWQTARAAVLSNVPYLGKAPAYVNVPVLTGTQLYRFIVTAAGSATPLFQVTPNQPGVAAGAGGTLATAQPGVRIAGSVMTAAIFAGSTAGRRQSAAANQSPVVQLLVDKVLQ